jgi:hypothetical protein
MAYTDDPPGMTKCVSTLDVEVFATRMSKFIDTTGDGQIGEDNILLANDQEGDRASGIGNAFHVQHPRDHYYASATGSPYDCPQPDLGLLPGEPTNWQPEPATAERVLTVTSPADGETTDGTVTVTGTVERRYEADTSWNPHLSEDGEVVTASGAERSASGGLLGALGLRAIDHPTQPRSLVCLLDRAGVASPAASRTAAAEEGPSDPVEDETAVADGELPATETVVVSLDGTILGSQVVYSRESADEFAIDVELEPGTRTLQLEWEDRGTVIASETVTITVAPSGD